MSRNIFIERIYPHPPESVWEALTSREALSEWLMDNDFQPYVGCRFQFRTQPSWGFDGVVHCEVIAVDRPRKLVYTWQGGPLRRPTTVTWLLEPHPDGTRLQLRHDGFEGAAGIVISWLLGSGWGGLLDKRLPEVIRHMTQHTG